VNNCDTTEAAQLAADVLGIDYRAAQTDPTAASQRREQLEADRQQREQERQQQAAEDAEQRRATFARLYAGMRQSVTQGESEYLQSKGLTGFTYPLCLMVRSCLSWWMNPAQWQPRRPSPRREKSDF
jgi:putative DNA primase/helicase